MDAVILAGAPDDRRELAERAVGDPREEMVLDLEVKPAREDEPEGRSLGEVGRRLHLRPRPGAVAVGPRGRRHALQGQVGAL